MSKNKKIIIILFIALFLIGGVWLLLNSRLKCKLIYGKNICNFYEMMETINSDSEKSDFKKAMQLCAEMENVPKKDSCFEYIAEIVSTYDKEKAKEACENIQGFDEANSQENCYSRIEYVNDLPNSYLDEAAGFTIRYPADYLVDTSYKYQGLGPDKNISGVKFTIPETLALGTNLSSYDTGVSVEIIPAVRNCNAGLFIYGNTDVQTINENGIYYSFASTNEGAAGNFYEEKVWALPGTHPCLAVRYFIHSTNIANYPEGTISEFDRASLIKQFDKIKHSLTVQQLSFFENLSCKEMYNNIENDIKNANYCETDSDCDILILGGEYIDWGCYHFINKAVDKDQFYKKMDIYSKQCSEMIDLCVPAPAVQCLAHKCVSAEEE